MKIRRAQIAGMNQHYRHYRYEAYLESMCACGITSLEMWCGSPHFLLDSNGYSDCGRYRRMAEERGLRYVSLTSPSMQWQYQLAAASPEQRRKSLRYFANGVHAAAELGCKVMAINSGWGYANEPREDAFARSAEMIANVADTAREDGVLLALETLQPMESNLVLTIADARKLVSMVSHPSVKLMIDNVAVGVAGETPEQWFAEFGNDIVHCHFIDGAPSGHMAWGDGEYPLEKTLAAFADHGYEGILTAELGGRYLNDPFSAERRNMSMLERFLAD